MSDVARAFYEKHGTFHLGDSGLDLFCTTDFTVPGMSTQRINLAVKAAAYIGDRNVSFLVLPRSSISKTPLRLANSIGLIDAGYRGELIAVVDNIRHNEFAVKAGDRLFQAVFFDGAPFDLEIVEALEKTARGEGGFGSTGRNVAEGGVVGR